MSPSPRQQSLFTQDQLLRAGVAWVPEHGGDIRQGRRKIARPFDSKRFVHIVLKSSKARGKFSFLHHSNRSKTSRWIYGRAKAHQVHIEKLSNVGNHLHLLAKAPSREKFQAFLKSITGPLARLITGAKKGLSTGKFWDGLAFTRMISWGRELNALKSYLAKNDLQAVGFGGARLKFVANAQGKSEAVILIGYSTPEDDQVFERIKARRATRSREEQLKARMATRSTNGDSKHEWRLKARRLQAVSLESARCSVRPST